MRAVLIFFADDESLKAYRESGQLSRIIASGCAPGDILVLDNETLSEHRASQIRRACQQKRVTLCSREFGRGEDFIVHIQRLSRSGGIHVIQTFLSEEQSEEIQIKGRTGRQDNLGSFSMVLSESEVDVESLNARNQSTDTQCYAILNKNRRDKYESICKTRFKRLPEAFESDRRSQNFISSVLAGDIAAASVYLYEENKALDQQQSQQQATAGAVRLNAGSVSRTCVLIDGTKSMDTMFSAVLETIDQLFQEVRRIINEKGVECTFEVQFVVYRNYDVGPAKILQCSDWSDSHIQLLPFLTEIKCFGGGDEGREAIEVGLQYVNKEIASGRGATQVIIIGDASYNRASRIPEYRSATSNPRLWEAFPKTEMKTEMRGLPKSVPVHTFMVLPRTTALRYVPESIATYQKEFTQIAKDTKGSSFTLNVNDRGESFADYMDKFAITILKDIGKSSDLGDELADFYTSERNRISHAV